MALGVALFAFPAPQAQGANHIQLRRGPAIDLGEEMALAVVRERHACMFDSTPKRTFNVDSASVNCPRMRADELRRGCH